MTILTIFQRGTPDIINLILLLIGALLCILAINTLYEWLKTKPWHKNNHPPENIDAENVPHPPDQTSDNTEQHDSFNLIAIEAATDH